MYAETEAVPLTIGPHTAGVALSASEFDSAEGEPGWRYELIRGVVVVSPAPSPMERGPNEPLDLIPVVAGTTSNGQFAFEGIVRRSLTFNYLGVQ